MKKKQWSVLLALAAGLSAAMAQTLVWDTVPGTVGPGDGSITADAGTWDTATGNWTADSGANNVAWVNGSNAEFTGGNYTVDLGSGVVVGGITHAGNGPVTIKALVDNTALTVAGSPVWNLNNRTLNLLNDGVNDTALAMASGQTLTVTGAQGTFNTGEKPDEATWGVAGATLDFQAGELRGNVDGAGNFSLVKMAGGSIYYHERNRAEVYTNNWELGSGIVTFDNRYNSRSVTLNGVISGAGTILVNDMGIDQFVLAAGNTFTGGIIIDNATLENRVSISSDSQLGTVPVFDADNIILRNNGQLRLQAVALDPNRGIALDNGGTIILPTGPSSASAITGTGDLQIGVATVTQQNSLTLTGSSDYDGETRIVRGFIRLGADNALPAGTLVVIGGASGGTAVLEMNGYDQTIAGLATVGTNTRRIDNNGAGVATLTFDFPSGTHRNFGGNIGGTSPVFIVKNGTGSQQIGRKDPITPLAGATINEGRLRLDGPILPIGSVTVKSGADLVVNVGAADEWLVADIDDLLANATLESGARVTLNATSGDFTYPNAITGPITFARNGGGNVTLTAANTYTGTTYLEATGTKLTLGASASIADSPLIRIGPNSTLDVSGVSGGFSLAAGQRLTGNGFVEGAVSTVPSSVLTPGGDNLFGDLKISGDLDISAIAGADAGGLEFAFGIGGAAGIVLTNHTLSIGSGLLGFADFAFTDVDGMESGAYTLFSAAAISGSLNPADLSGPVGDKGATGALSASGSGIVLTVAGADYSPYGQWVAGFGLAGADALEDADPDGDGWSNLMEYAFGGNPADGNIVGNVPAYGKSVVGGTNWFTYTYAYRTDPASGLDYTLESSGNLVYVPWSESNHTLLGIGEIDADFSAQTNGVLLDANNAYFFKLLVEKQ